MYIHLGRDTVVSAREVVGVLDLDTSTFSKHTKNFLTSCEKKGTTPGSKFLRKYSSSV